MYERRGNIWLGLFVVILAALCTGFNLFSVLQLVKIEAGKAPIVLDLGGEQWEGIIWQGYDRGNTGLAVRRLIPKSLRTTGYKRGDTTPWGICHRWSINSRGKYCLISPEDLSVLGWETLQDSLYARDYESIP